ncbi:hypothetical protein ACFLY3_02745 [Chloroflexota bacterium]
MIDWSKLKPYHVDKRLSFEELCYQVAQGLYDDKGNFTSIDDTGGGDGVEFYLTLPNGEQWGWQAKFYYPNLRLGVSNRKASIKNSLEVACHNHPNLTKWILCTPTNFTKQEQTWFEANLPNSIPNNMNVTLEHWGDSDLNNWLSEPRFSGKKLYFFGELELNSDWFRTQFEKQIASVQDKYNEVLHTETDADAYLHAFLGDAAFAKSIAERLTSFERDLEEFGEAATELQSDKPYGVDWLDTKATLVPLVEGLKDTLMEAIRQLREAHDYLEGRQLDEVRSLNWDVVWTPIEQAHDNYREAVSAIDMTKLGYKGDEKNREYALRDAERILHRPRWMAANLMDKLRDTIARFKYITKADLHLLGEAGVGKTHLSSHICLERLESDLPELLVLGLHFTSDEPLHTQLLAILDIPAAHSWHDFLCALEAAAQAYHTLLPIVIDGLNDAMRNGAFSDVWKTGLAGFIQEIAQTKNVVLITTSRTTYKEAIWPDGVPENVKYVYGFDAYNVELALEKYFSWYKIKADITAAPLSQFEHPIYLRIFCESQNSEREEEKEVYIGEQTLFEIFDNYISRCNRAICERLGLHPDASVVMQALNDTARYLWENHSRHITLIKLTEMVDHQQLGTLNWMRSKTKAILDEGLLVCRDWHSGEEVVYFTYDLLGGYIIAKYLVQKSRDDIQAFVRSQQTVTALFSDDYSTLHPLHSDIGRSLAALLPMQTGRYLHELTDSKKAFALSINALFELQPNMVSESCVQLVERLFNHPQNRKPLFELAASTVAHLNHPLNASFWSKLLKTLPMPERDVSWTEYVRENSERMEKTLARFEELCRSKEALSGITESRIQLIAEHIMWVLTSTVRPLRDKATRALYWFGRRMPEHLLSLAISALSINDPYIPERMLAGIYGVGMASQFDFIDSTFAEKILPIYGRKLYDAMFAPNALYSTTHILTRDYARHATEIALIHHPDLLEEGERERMTPPFSDGGIREWGQSEDKNEGEYRAGNAPIQMDFKNYTIGSLVEGRQNYDDRPLEYKTAVANIFWRIYDLGYSLEAFGEIDKYIASLHWSREQSRGKVDRYGKKYSWIAFYELAGFRQDKGMLYMYDEARISDADIDPSFPELAHDFQVVDGDLLGNRDVPLHEWIETGDNPDIAPYLVLENLCNEKGPWVLLDGFICQEDSNIRRSCTVFPHSILIQNTDFKEVLALLHDVELRWGRLPGVPEDYYTYAGEIPWSDTFKYNGQEELEFIISTKKVPHDYPAFCEGRTLSTDREIEVPDKTKTVMISIPVRNNNWESSHSVVNHDRFVLVPSKEIAEFLDLCSQPQTFDLYEKNGRRASITIQWGDTWHTGHKLVFLRKDLLDRYLEKNGYMLAWVIGGERQFKSIGNEGLDEFAEKYLPYKSFQEIKEY